MNKENAIASAAALLPCLKVKTDTVMWIFQENNGWWLLFDKRLPIISEAQLQQLIES